MIFILKEELEDTRTFIENLNPLFPDISYGYKIVLRERTTSKRGEYCVLIYSEKKEGYLLNIGYFFEQLDLFFAANNIGACWYGVGKIEKSLQTYQEKEFVIMIAIGKGLPIEFRKDYRKAKRKLTKEIWSTMEYRESIGEIVKYAPNTCNLQPWYVESSENFIKVYRRLDIKTRLPREKVLEYNHIDLGIFLLFLEIVFVKENIDFTRELHSEGVVENRNLLPVATYTVLKNPSPIVPNKNL